MGEFICRNLCSLFLFFFSACIQQNSFLEGFYKPSTHHELPKTSLAQISAVQYHWFPYLFRVAGTRLKFSALFVYMYANHITIQFPNCTISPDHFFCTTCWKIGLTCELGPNCEVYWNQLVWRTSKFLYMQDNVYLADYQVPRLSIATAPGCSCMVKALSSPPPQKTNDIPRDKHSPLTALVSPWLELPILQTMINNQLYLSD